jgi:hypothetical protein
MKIIETLNSGMKKIAKGMFALFTINLLIFGGVLLIQSCQTDDEIFENNNQKIELEKFKELVINTVPKAKKTTLKSNLLSKNANLENENNAKESLKSLSNGSRDLLESYGFTTKEIEDEYGSWDDPKVVSLSLTLFRLEQINEKSNKTSFNFSPLFIQSSYAQNSIKDCALRALGVDKLVDWARGKYLSGYAARKALIKAVGKAAARFGLGWIGTAIAVVEFAECMS